jgi:dihydrofolate synthase/folylpolyglutamate synthase
VSRVFESLAPLVAKGMVLGLDGMRDALRASGDPQRRIPCAHIAGTNGKGSVSALMDGALRAAKIRTGLYTSPHLHRFVERIRVNGVPLGDDLAADLADAILEEMARGALPSLTFFEAATLLAWRAFARAGVSFAVLEVGLGGRLDATTVCEPEVTVITRIAYDHTDRLGTTLDAIAREKAGILKPGVPCVLGPDLTMAKSPEARAAIEAVARAVGAPLIDTGAYEVRGEAVLLRWCDEDVTLRPSLAGAWQMGNVATAARALEVLAGRREKITDSAMAEGFATTRWPARMERVGGVLFDAAHNLDGARALVEALRGQRVGAVVFGASRDKDYAGMLAALEAVAEPARWFFAAAPMARAVEPETLAAQRGGAACASPEEALAAAQARCGAGEVVLVCGSIYFVARVRAALLGLEQEPPIGL